MKSPRMEVMGTRGQTNRAGAPAFPANWNSIGLWGNHSIKLNWYYCPASHYSALKIKMSAVCCNRSEEHTSELQSRGHLVCRLLLEKKKTNQTATSEPIRPMYRSL